MMFDLSGHMALVTGAGQNVGAGIARALAGQGATVAVNDLRPERADAVVKEIIAAGGQAVAAPFDVTDLDAVAAGVSAIGAVDILVNNAGNWGAQTIVLKPFRELDAASWEGPIRVNLYGVMYCCRVVGDRSDHPGERRHHHHLKFMS